MKILENELVRKYFGWEGDCAHGGYHCSECMALRVLEAMGQPIGNGEKYLVLCEEGIKVAAYMELKHFHPSFARLPDCFQRPSEKKEQSDL